MPKCRASAPCRVCVCDPWPAAGSITCTVSVNNTGTVRVKGVLLMGPENNCSVASVLAPGQASSVCTVHLAVTQADFDAREADPSTATELSVEVGATATANVTNPAANSMTDAPADTTVFSGLQLEVRRNLTAAASLSRLTVNLTGAGQRQGSRMEVQYMHVQVQRMPCSAGLVLALYPSYQPQPRCSLLVALQASWCSTWW